MDSNLLLIDAKASLTKLENLFLQLHLSRCYLKKMLLNLSIFFHEKLGKTNSDQDSFFRNCLNLADGESPNLSFEDEIKKADWFIPYDNYLVLSDALHCISDYILALSDQYSEYFSKDILKEMREKFLLPVQKENKGLSLVYLANF